MVANGVGRRPGITLVTLCGRQTIAKIVQRWRKHHARIDLLFHLSHTGLARNRIVSLVGTITGKCGAPLIGTYWKPRGAMMTSLRGGMQNIRQLTLSIALPPPPDS